MFRRIFAFLLLGWVLGFAWFALFLPQPAGPVRTDAAVVLTGGKGRIERGIEALDRGWTDQLLVSGVGDQVTQAELAEQHAIPQRLLSCCITLGYDAVDTRSNAAEAAAWVHEHDFRSIRLITSDWHMRRARFDIDQVLDSEVETLTDAVSTEPTMFMLFLEYHKFIARNVVQWLGL
ncbi:YdcF family protein [Croceicoccus sp. F390]|uniref:YdcF family protein n=1 Tax=Croceicoccus esteveae TaxID=3075597 RepID=A0ABU2ZHR5_9SPHN|nr:YdcF family protein [Croceicoccus sp. F390]MDT0576144.1 YdcF family protein [Croceicoccus sp. F390]